MGRVGDHQDGLGSSELRNFLLHLMGADPTVEGQFGYHQATDTFRFKTAGAVIVLGRLDQISSPSAAVSMATQKLTNLANGTAAGDAVNLGQLQDAVAGLAWKDSVRLATTADGTLATAYENGDTVDGVVLATGDRILLKNQATASQNGIYTVNASGAPTRTDDANSATDIRAATVFVEEGTANAGSIWTLATDPPITLDTTNLSFAQFGAAGSYTAGNGIGLSGSQFFVSAGTGLTQDADGLSLSVPVTVSNGGTGATDAAGARTNLGAVTRYATNIGTGAASMITVTHSLGTLDIIVQVWDIASGEMEAVGVDKTGVNACDIIFSYTPANASKRVVVMA